MSEPLYTPPNGLFARPTCQPRRFTECAEPYLPEKPRASPAATPASRSAAVISSNILPVILTAAFAGGVTAYAISQKISFDYIVRGVIFSINGVTNTATSDLMAALRYSAGSVANQATWDGGQPLLNSYGASENIAIGGTVHMEPLWIPVSTGGARLIARWSGDNTNDLSGSVTVLITPASDLEIDFGLQPPANPLGAPPGEPGCVLQYRPPILGADGLLYPSDAICLDPTIINGRYVDYKGNDLGPAP